MKKRILLTIVLAGACGIVARAESSAVQVRCEAPCSGKTPWTGIGEQGVAGDLETTDSETSDSEVSQSGTVGMALAGLTLVGMSGLRRKKVVL